MPRIAQGMKKSLIGAVTTIAVCLLGAVPAVAVYGNEPSQPQSGSTATVQSNQPNGNGNIGVQGQDSQSSQDAPARPQDSSTDADNAGKQSDSSAPNATAPQSSRDEANNNGVKAANTNAPTTESETLAQLAKDNKDTIKDGIYAFASGVGGNQVLDVNGGVLTDKANVQTYHNNYTSGQRWKVTHDENGFIALTNLHSGKVLDVNHGVAQVGANVQQYTAHNGLGQQWIAVPAADGKSFVLYSALSMGLRLDVYGAVSRDKTNVQVYRPNDSQAQRWSLDTTPYVQGTIESYWRAHGALGEPKSNEQTIGDYLTQEFTNGVIYVKTAGDAKNTVYAVQGAMHDLYVKEGGPAGWLGYPVGNEQTAKDRVAQSFEHGSIISRNNGKTVTALTEEISDYWASQKGAQGWLGWPKGSAETADGRTVQEFDGGTVYVYPNGGTVPSISGKRSQSGDGLLGDSASNVTVKTGKYYIHEYANGAILATSETDASTATVMNGDIFSYWNKRGGMTGSLGLPTGDAQTIGDGSAQAFKNGTVYTLPKVGTYFVHDDNLREFTKQGGPAGKLGFPTSDETRTVRDGVRQTFEHGVMYWHNGSGSGSHTLSGEFLQRYNAQGAEAGDRGFPISGEYNDRGHTRQDFEHGSYWQGGMPAGVYSHNVRWAGQPNNFYCAPASGYMIFATAGRNTAAGGAPLSIEAMAQYMHTALPAGTWEADAVNGMNNWIGTPMFAAHGYPSYEVLRNEVMHSYETGYAPMLFTYERRGGAHPNGHANASFGHAMVVDAYNTQDDGVLIADPLASYGGSQKFWDRLGPFREYYMTWSLDSDPAAIITAR